VDAEQRSSRPARPPALTVIAWIFMLVGAAGLLNDLWPLVTPHAAEQVAKLKADGLADLGPAWSSRLAAVIGGAYLFRGFNWARWLLVAWMVFHLGLSAFHSWQQLLLHAAIFTPILYFLFAQAATAFLSHGR
jgi:hypothetical protein